MRRYIPVAILAVMLTCLFEGCICGKAHPAEQSAFEVLAGDFKRKAGANRFEEARKLADLLPQCPLTSYKDTGIGIATSYDYSRPSYLFSKDQLFEALGKPSSFHQYPYWDVATYQVDTPWYMHIVLRGGYVSETLFDTWGPK